MGHEKEALVRKLKKVETQLEPKGEASHKCTFGAGGLGHELRDRASCNNESRRPTGWLPKREAEASEVVWEVPNRVGAAALRKEVS